jgi:ribonuclease HI
MTKKWYVVWNGRKRGIFDSWDECLESVDKFPGARYKSFKCKARAEAEHRGEALMPPPPTGDPNDLFDTVDMSVTVDGACSGSGEDASGEYRGVLLPSRREIFRAGPWKHSTNNIMEYLAAVRGLRWMSTRGLRIPVYTDSRVALEWLKNDPEFTCRTTRAPPPDSALADEMRRARTWIRGRTDGRDLVDCLRKWDTGSLGEIPADFNRK